MLKLSKFKPVTTATMEVLDPLTGSPTGATITFMSPEHPQAKEEQWAHERSRREAARKRAAAGPEDPESESDRVLYRMAFLTVKWDGFADDDGTPMSIDRVRETYEGYPWLLTQALRFVGEQRNFIPGSSIGSSSMPAPASA